MMKKCTKCNKVKSINDFTPRKGRPVGLMSRCKECLKKQSMIYRKKNPDRVRQSVRSYRNRNIEKRRKESREYLRNMRKRNPEKQRAYKLKFTYGITSAKYQEILKSQAERCAICNTNKPNGRGFTVDHNHSTGVIRGILCHSCNTSLGGFRDSPELLKKAIEYLVSPRLI